MPTSLSPSFVNNLAGAIKQLAQVKTKTTIARVVHVVTGPYYEGTDVIDTYYNNPTDIGTITFQFINSNQNRTSNSAGNHPAKPISSALRHYPVEGELVEIVVGPSIKMNTDKEAREYYYTNPYNVWGCSHHNAHPDLGDYADYSTSTKRSYQQNQATNQASNVAVTSSVNYPLGPNFPEKTHLKNLIPFAGDVLLEGRWGNSIRFGSTSALGKFKNTWSSAGDAGDPITIIRNGQGRSLDETAWVPTVEDINRDPSSIYLTAGQKIVIDDIQNNYSLASLGIVLETTYTNTIALQQALTSFESISPAEQDKYVSENV